MSRPRAQSHCDRRGRRDVGVSPVDLYDYDQLPPDDGLYGDDPLPPERRVGRPLKHDLSTWTVTDDWPERVPVTEAEVDVFEAWFGDLFDELFGSNQ